MSHIDSAFALASRSTPVRDELVDSLDDIFPELKSAQGIPVIKHSKRGQSETRRLRLDTDVSTLEVFRTSTGYLNRKMSTRTYGLSTLEAVRTSKILIVPNRTSITTRLLCLQDTMTTYSHY